MWKIGTVRGYNRGWTSDIYTEKTPDFWRFKYSFNKRSLRLFLLYPWKNEKFNQNIIHWTVTLITPLFGIVHFKTNYNYRLSNHCFINELILVTYALISNAVEKYSEARSQTYRQLSNSSLSNCKSTIAAYLECIKDCPIQMQNIYEAYLEYVNGHI